MDQALLSDYFAHSKSESCLAWRTARGFLGGPAPHQSCTAKASWQNNSNCLKTLIKLSLVESFFIKNENPKDHWPTKKLCIWCYVRAGRGGPYSFLRPKNRVFIEKLLTQTATRFRVKLYRKAIAGNHLHLIILCPDKDSYHGFISVVSGRLASHVMNYQSFNSFVKSLNAANRISAAEVFGTDQRFFNFRPFSRVLNWGKDFTASCSYIQQNTLEALGFIAYKPRKDFYSRWIVRTYPVLSSA